jgi:hypothetical protein
MNEKIINFLNTHPLINIHKLEDECRIPATTIAHAVEGRRNIPAKYFDSIDKVLKKYGFKTK